MSHVLFIPSVKRKENPPVPFFRAVKWVWKQKKNVGDKLDFSEENSVDENNTSYLPLYRK